MRIILQAGHYSRTSGSTGAPGEADFNWDVANKVAESLRKYMEVRVVKADPTSSEISGDWDCFLAIHYDADIYGKGGYFVDYCEPSLDGVTNESQRITKCISEEYGKATGIVNHPERSNINTRKYYMWSKLSAKTPCVLIECGVGQHKPDDYDLLFNQRQRVVDGLVAGLRKAFNLVESQPAPDGDSQKAIAILRDYQLSNQHGNLEGAINALVGSAKEIVTVRNELSNLRVEFDTLKQKFAELDQNFREIQKSALEWQSEAETANKKLTKTLQNLDEVTKERDDWRTRYNNKNTEYNTLQEDLDTTIKEGVKKELEKKSGWSLIRLGINKLTVKK